MKKRIFGLDILRVIGVLFIFCYHYTVEYLLTAGGQSPTMGGLNYFFNIMARPASISLFIISGYALMHNHEDEIPLKDYFLRRFKGLYIPFYVAYALMFFLYFFVNNAAQGGNAANYTFVYTIIGIDGIMNQIQPNFYMIGEWFMSCIVICYLLFPLLAKLLKKWAWITLAVLCTWSGVILYVYNPFPLSTLQNPLFIMVYFYSGMLLNKYMGDKEIKLPVKIISIIVFVLSLAFFMILGYRPEMIAYEFSLEVKEIFYALMSFALFFMLRDVDMSPERVTYKLTAYISKISWYVILMHHGIMILFYYYKDVSNYHKKEFIASFLFFVLVSIILAELVMKVSTWIKQSLFSNKKKAN